jgi:hypothetical protein
MAAYVRAYFFEGRVYAPLSPLVTRLADRVWFDGPDAIIQRDGHRIRVKSAAVDPAALHGVYVAVGPVLRALGATVRYEPSGHRLAVQLAEHTVVALPTSFNPREPSPMPTAVFTPAVVPTPRPIWTGSPLPRRTGLPFPPVHLPQKGV